jgi:DNA-binding NarL/FixJ family response regulator
MRNLMAADRLQVPIVEDEREVREGFGALLESLVEAARRGAPMSPEVAQRVVLLFGEFQSLERVSYSLTPQETALLKLLVDGHHYKTAAKEMRISVNTVSFHLKNIYGKLRVHSKTEAVAKALRERLV